MAPEATEGDVVRHTYYVPELRIVRLGNTLTKGELGGPFLQRLRRDVISLEITSHASGPGEYRLTLNNWDARLPELAPPSEDDDSAPEPPPRWLRHKYNSFDRLRPGFRLRFDLRYWPAPGTTPGDKDAAKKTPWIPMIAGPITDMQFSYGGEGDRVSVTGVDDLQMLDRHAEKKVTHQAPEDTIITRTLEAARCPLERVPAVYPQSMAFMTGDPIHATHDRGQSHLSFIQGFVDRYDLEIFLAFVPRGDAGFEQQIHIVPSRARSIPNPDAVPTLRRNGELLDVKPTIKVRDQITEARVRGRNRHRNEPKGVDGRAGEEVVVAELAAYEEKPAKGKIVFPLVPSTTFRREQLGENVDDSKEKTNLDEYRAEAAAQAILLRKARELLEVQATAIGRPDLRAGDHVRIDEVGPPFDGLYYVVTATHSWGSDGLKTSFTARRPGMPKPPYEPKPLPEEDAS